VPQGYRPPYTIIIAQKNGTLATSALGPAGTTGTGNVSSANLAEGRNVATLLTGSGDITNAALALVVQGVATLTGSGTISNADILGKLEGAATLAGAGDLTGAMTAFASAIAALTGSGTVVGDFAGSPGSLSANITPFTTLSPENLASAVWNSLIADFTVLGSMGEVMQPVYTAKLLLFDDDAATTDRYVVSWFKNGVVITSGITSPTIQVVRAADGTNLIPSTAMTEIASLGRYRYNATGGQRIIAGVSYIVFVSATIDGAVREWDQPMGRDST
jgi:hypothetical protein